ncbi:hypothetical protein [Dryocola clanedunensis]
MNTSVMLKALANGINPDTGELLPRTSIAHAPDLIRQLFTLAEEFIQRPTEKKTRLTPEERQQKNLAQGKPAKSFFPWSEDEKQRLEADYRAGKTPEMLSHEFCRSVRAVAIQLEKMGLITAEQLLSYGL